MRAKDVLGRRVAQSMAGFGDERASGCKPPLVAADGELHKVGFPEIPVERTRGVEGKRLDGHSDLFAVP